MKNMLSKKRTHHLIVLGEICLLTAITLFAVFPISCKVTTSGIEIIGSDYTVPSLDGYSVESSEKLVLEFSEEVNLLSAVVSPAIIEDSDSSDTIAVDISYSKDNRTVIVNFLSEIAIGQSYKFYGEVENKKGSSLMFAVPFVGYNPRVPDLLLSEVHDGKVGKTNKKAGLCEYVEFVALNDGNLSGLVVKSACDGDGKSFMMPPIEVKKGDYITVHYRKTEGHEDECISEITGDKTLSSALGSSDSSWDLWDENNSEARLGTTHDIITLENSNTGEILQSLFYSLKAHSKTKKEFTEWSDDKYKDKANDVFESELWYPSANVTDAFLDDKTSIKGIIRTNVSEIIKSYESGTLTYPFASNATEWMRITETDFSPGLENTFTPPKKK